MLAAIALLAIVLPQDVKPQERFLEGTKGRYLLLKPDNTTPKSHLWVALHGNTGAAEDSVQVWGPEAAKRGNILVAVQGSGPADQAGKNTWNAEADSASIIAITKKVAEEFHIDKMNVAIFGFSAGNMAANEVVKKNPDTYWFFGELSPALAADFDQTTLQPAAKKVVMFYGVGKMDRDAYRTFRKTTIALQTLGFNLGSEALDDVGHEILPLRRPMLAFYDEQYKLKLAALQAHNLGTTNQAQQEKLVGYKAVQDIFNRYCIQCHNPRSRPRIDLTNYAGLMRGGPGGMAVRQGDAVKSQIFQFVSGPNPKMPRGGDPLTVGELQILKDWINSGANNK